MDKRFKFLEAVLGREGAQALGKASARSEALGNVLVPRTLMSWLGIMTKNEYEGQIPGIDNTFVALKKTESGYYGQVNVGDDVHHFDAVDSYHVAAAMAVAMGLDDKGLDSGLRDLDVVRLGKSIDLLVKARIVTQELLAKKVLDQESGYSFQHEIDDNPKFPSVTIYAHAPSGERIGFAKFHHQADKLAPFGVYVEDDHQRKGLASHMYSLAQKISGKPIVQGKVQTAEGEALWHGNDKVPQFGSKQPQIGLHKTDQPGQTAMPTPAAGPLQAEPPSIRQTQIVVRLKGKKSKIPKIPRFKIPGLPKIQTLKLSEAQLNHACPACASSQLKDGKLVGCTCFRVLFKNIETVRSGADFVITFDEKWDEDEIQTFLETIRTPHE